MNFIILYCCVRRHVCDCYFLFLRAGLSNYVTDLLIALLSCDVASVQCAKSAPCGVVRDRMIVRMRD